MNLNQAQRMIATWRRTAPEEKKAAWATHRASVLELRSMVDALARRLVAK